MDSGQGLTLIAEERFKWLAGTNMDDATRVNASVCWASACDDVVCPGLFHWDAIVSTIRYDRYSLGTVTVYRAVDHSASGRRCGNHQVEASARETRHRRHGAAQHICTEGV